VQIPTQLDVDNTH